MSKIENLVIIGSGPAGLTAGIYSSRANLNPIIIEGNNPGGQLMTTSYVENWPGEKSILGATLMHNMREHAKHFGANLLSETVTELEIQTPEKTGQKNNIFVLHTNKDKEIRAKSIIIATGASARKLGCEGEAKYWSKGITTCAICDGYFYKDKSVVILGGGDTAMEDANFMQNFTKDITVIHIGEKFSASSAMQEKVLNNPNIKVIYNSTITKFFGQEDTLGQEHLTGIEITNKNTGQVSQMKIDGVFLAIGQTPNTGFLKGKIDLSAYGHAIIGKNNTKTATSAQGIFAAGDVADAYYKQAIVSSGSGCMAALDAERYLSSIA